MQSEEFDKKITEAADHHHPAYDEHAWSNMEKLLDKHLPQKKDDNRRIIFFLFLFLLLGGTAFLGVSKPWQRTGSLTKIAEKDQQNIVSPATGNPEAKETNPQIPAANINPDKGDNINKNITGTNVNTSPVPETNAPQNISTTNVNGNSRQTRIKGTSSILSKQPGINKSDVELNENKIIPSPVVITANEKSINKNVESNNENPVTEKKNIEPQTQLIAGNNAEQKKIAGPEKEQVKNDAKAVAPTPVIKKAGNNKKNNFFFLSLSAGPDVSSAGGDDLGTIKLLVGAGLGYTFHQHFTIKTGFYAVRKIYSASPDEYHPPSSFWAYYPNLQQVEADCKVYEIPLLFSYNFGKSTKQNWFATTGLSSYLMKKETYNYLYKNPSGQLAYHEYTLLDQNKHYFSVLTLSGGYQRNLNKTFSIMAEPYLKVPLTGIGFGNVKLNSGGILFSVGIKPFAAAKK